MVAPNSPSARAHASTRPASRPGPASGRDTRRNVVHRLAPRVAATTSYSRSVARSAPSTASTKNGRDTKAWATTTAGVVNGRLTPKASYSGAPTTPRRPNAESSATPPTTGGSTSGTITKARTTVRPGNSTRARAQASGIPTAVTTATAASEVTIDSRRASRTAG